MRNPVVIGGLIVSALFLGIPGALAGPWEDGMAAYNRGDYVPAIRLFRPLAENGNPKAQGVLGKMYRKGQGVARNPVQAFMWFSLAARRGDARAGAEMREVSQAMTPQERSQANEMAQACEASNYRACEYF
jgi:TPR repeat protein